MYYWCQKSDLREAVLILSFVICAFALVIEMLHPSNTYTFRLFKMKVMLDAISLCESAADHVGPTLEKFKQRRQKGHFKSATKLNSIVDTIMAKPKKFLNLSMENLQSLSGLNQNELRHELFVAVRDLGKPRYKNRIQVLVFETDDERVLRGN